MPAISTKRITKFARLHKVSPQIALKALKEKARPATRHMPAPVAPTVEDQKPTLGKYPQMITRDEAEEIVANEIKAYEIVKLREIYDRLQATYKAGTNKGMSVLLKKRMLHACELLGHESPLIRYDGEPKQLYKCTKGLDCVCRFIDRFFCNEFCTRTICPQSFNAAKPDSQANPCQDLAHALCIDHDLALAPANWDTEFLVCISNAALSRQVPLHRFQSAFDTWDKEKHQRKVTAKSREENTKNNKANKINADTQRDLTVVDNKAHLQSQETRFEKERTVSIGKIAQYQGQSTIRKTVAKKVATTAATAAAQVLKDHSPRSKSFKSSGDLFEDLGSMVTDLHTADKKLVKAMAPFADEPPTSGGRQKRNR